MTEVLRDLDALALTVRDPRSRTYIRESIACYRAGAYRAAVVSVWIAVAFDILIKIRELKEQGDAVAQRIIDDYEKGFPTCVR